MDETSRLLRQGLRLEYLTLSWNGVGLFIIFAAAARADSVALAGFGLDSLIEIGASVVVIWTLTEAGKTRQKRALRLIGVAFFGLALYVLSQSGRTLFSGLHPESSVLGMIWLGLTFIVMLALAFGKWQVGRRLEHPVLLTEGRVTLVDALLAGAVLVGIALNGALGWWWADPLASLIIVAYGVKEGLHAFKSG